LQKTWLPKKTEIIIINNGGNDANAKIPPKSYKKLNVKFLEIPNRGYPQGNNVGAKAASGKYLAFINPDIEVEKDTFKILFEYLEDNSKIGIVAPQLHYPDGIIQDNYRVFPRFVDLVIKRTNFLRKMFPQRMRRYLMWDKEPSVNEPVDWVTGAFMIVRKECFKKVGKHDEHYFLFMSDVEICQKTWANNFEVHFVGSAHAQHNETRLSGGGFTDLFRKKTLRIHLHDALKYYFRHLIKRLPKNSPSLSQVNQKERVHQARKLSATSFLHRVSGKLQRYNPVVNVFRGKVVGPFNYEQPVIFFNTGVVSVVRNQKGQFGLIKTWRHTPLSFEKQNTFPIFPDVANLGMWSLECPRGGVEKSDPSPEISIKRELNEEIGLKEKQIISITPLGKIINDTAINVQNHLCFEIVVSDDFVFKPDPTEMINEFKFYDLKEIYQLIQEKKLFCSMSQAAILQAVVREL